MILWVDFAIDYSVGVICSVVFLVSIENNNKHWPNNNNFVFCRTTILQGFL